MPGLDRTISDLSLRDPDGAVRIHDGCVLRLIAPAATERFADTLKQPIVHELLAAGDIVKTCRASELQVPDTWRDMAGALYEHELAPFPSQPREWPPAMLARAGEFTLELALRLLPHGLWLKDATPTNIQFFGPKPVLVDVPSIVPRPRGAYLWPARQQFEATFLLPLIANLERGLPVAWSLADPVAGITHEFCAQQLGLRRWLFPSLISGVALPAALNATTTASEASVGTRVQADDDKAVFILQRCFEMLLQRIRRLTKRLESRESRWNSYVTSRSHYESSDLERKRVFVAAALDNQRPDHVLDIGANTGEFSSLAAGTSRVVALEIDEVAGNSIFRRAASSGERILPLTLDFSRPTPAGGWRNAESTSFLDRAKGQFDLVLMLAVIHHLRATSGIPVTAIVQAAWEMTRKHLLIEFVPLHDPMFTRISRGREALFGDCLRDTFESILAQRFVVDSSEELPNGRVLYLAKRKSGSDF